MTQLWDVATVVGQLTGYNCAGAPATVTAYDYYTIGGGGGAATTVNGMQSAISGKPTSTTTSNPAVETTPVTAPGTQTPNPAASPTAPVVSHHLSGGEIAGIAIGALAGVAIILGLLLLLCLQHRRHKRERRQVPQPPNPQPAMQTPASHQPNFQSPMTNPHSSFMSMPSNTSSSAPLTHQNMAAISHQTSDIAPNDSASNIGGYQNSTVSQTLPPTYHSNTGSNAASQEHSGLGPLPSPQYPTGAAPFPHQNTSSVTSPGSVFGSMPPVHAPSVTSYRPPGE